MIVCKECQKSKHLKQFCGKVYGEVIFDTCRDCRMTPHAEKVARAEIVKKSSISRTGGKYTPPTWDIRAGSDAFLRIPSRRFT